MDGQIQRIILASQSPRRKELLTAMGVEFEAVPSDFDERLDDSRAPATVALELALGKASAVAERYPESLVIGSDTIVTVEGRQLEEPVDEADAVRLLRLLAGKPNDVTTAVAVVCHASGVRLTGTDTTRVYFKPYDAAAVTAYVATGDPMDKAGAYGIQSGAAPLINHIAGHYDTVIGLPTRLLASLLAEVGVAAASLELQPPVRQTL